MKRQATPGGGRPSKGDRRQFVTRVPAATSARGIEDLAERFDLSYSDTVAELIRLGLDHADDFVGPEAAQQEALPLKASYQGDLK